MGEKLKYLREYYGYSQSKLSKMLGIPQTSISNYEQQDEVSGMLDYIHKICKLFNIPVHEFFMNDISKGEYDEKLPSHITPEWNEALKILNTQVDIKTRIEVTKAFIQIMKITLSKYSDRLKDNPEYQKLMRDTEYQESEEKISSDLSKVAEKKD